MYYMLLQPIPMICSFVSITLDLFKIQAFNIKKKPFHLALMLISKRALSISLRSAL